MKSSLTSLGAAATVFELTDKGETDAVIFRYDDSNNPEKEMCV